MKKLKSILAGGLRRTTVFLAMAVTFITAIDWPCLTMGGEPEIPKSLNDMKIKIYGEI